MACSLAFALVLLAHAAPEGAAAHATLMPSGMANFSWVHGLGQHRAIITLPESHTPGAAAFATIPWQVRLPYL